jgi:hypothetical protein
MCVPGGTLCGCRGVCAGFDGLCPTSLLCQGFATNYTCQAECPGACIPASVGHTPSELMTDLNFNYNECV